MPTRKISAILSSEHRVERVFNKLTQTTVARHDITIQGDPDAIAEKFGHHYLKPDVIQKRQDAPKKEPYLADDFGWLSGFAFSIPMFIGIVIGVFLIGDVRSLADNLVFGLLGAVIGGVIGYVIAHSIILNRKKTHRTQEKQGGFVIWITISKDSQIKDVMAILKKYRATSIKIEKN